jgi:hypothetical protein
VRSINLLKLAAEAEKIRLRAMMARQARRAAFGLVALVFVLGVLALTEVAVWQVFRFYVAPLYATLILLGINLLFAGIFGFLAARSSPSQAEHEAVRVRQDALTAARGSLAITAAIPA